MALGLGAVLAGIGIGVGSWLSNRNKPELEVYKPQIRDIPSLKELSKNVPEIFQRMTQEDAPMVDIPEDVVPDVDLYTGFIYNLMGYDREYDKEAGSYKIAKTKENEAETKRREAVKKQFTDLMDTMTQLANSGLGDYLLKNQDFVDVMSGMASMGDRLNRFGEKLGGGSETKDVNFLEFQNHFKELSLAGQQMINQSYDRQRTQLEEQYGKDGLNSTAGMYALANLDNQRQQDLLAFNLDLSSQARAEAKQEQQLKFQQLKETMALGLQLQNQEFNQKAKESEMLMSANQQQMSNRLAEATLNKGIEGENLARKMHAQEFNSATKTDIYKTNLATRQMELLNEQERVQNENQNELSKAGVYNALNASKMNLWQANKGPLAKLADSFAQGGWAGITGLTRNAIVSNGLETGKKINDFLSKKLKF